MYVLAINREPCEYIGKNAVGNKYLHKWFVYVEDKRESEHGLYINDVKARVLFADSKPIVKEWLKNYNIEWDFENNCLISQKGFKE